MIAYSRNKCWTLVFIRHALIVQFTLTIKIITLYKLGELWVFVLLLIIIAIGLEFEFKICDLILVF